MRLLDRYIGRSVVVATLVVLSVLLALFTFIAFIAEMKMVGRGDYGTGLALAYVGLGIPRLVYQFMPIAALVGGLAGLGALASHSELTVIRAAGVSIRRITLSVFRAALLLIALAIVMGQWLAPKAERYAQELRTGALTGQPTLQTREGLWFRDGESFVHIRTMLDSQRLVGLRIYRLDARQRLRESLKATVARHDASGWRLVDVLRTRIGDDGPLRIERLEELPWRSTIEPDLLGAVAVRPEHLSIVDLYGYIGFLVDNGLDAARYELVFWRQLMTPVTTLIMLLLALPFIFGPLRSVSLGLRMLVGILLGVGFYIFDQISGYVGLVYGIDPLLCALVPPAAFLALAWLLLRRVF